MTIGTALAWTACDSHAEEGGSSGGHSSVYPACNDIIQACHPLDTGDGPYHDCHDLAHGATSEAACTPRRDECVKLCTDASADAGT
ncbi:MAG: hypothetical protein KIT84_39055 [Labilithrix sp.]|nr:hypothetical protein [Labilithrix sp.]MCW5817061.1 hypothetical protein [Labilithrix sp.]